MAGGSLGTRVEGCMNVAGGSDPVQQRFSQEQS